MLVISFCMKKFRAHFSRAGLLKLNCVLFWDICRSKNVLNTSAAAIYHPLHTVPLLEDSHVFKPSSVVGNILDYTSVSDPWLDVRNQKLERGLINYIAIINVKDLWKSDSFSNELLASNEFKNILSKWYLHYNVSFASHRSTEHLFSSNPVVSWPPQMRHNLFHHICPLNASVLGQNSAILKCEKNNSSKLVPEKSEKPSEEQLLSIINRLCHSLLHFFEQSHDFTMYHKNVVFQNNIKGIITTGILSYTQQMYLMKIYGHLHYGKVKVEILKITHHIDDGTIRVRWRVNGISRSRMMLMMLWKSKSSSEKKTIDENPEWLDGFSVFSVGPDGLIYKHVCDKMIPDDEKLLPKTNSFSTKLLVLLGLSRRPSTVSDLNAMLVLSPFDENVCSFILPTKTK